MTEKNSKYIDLGIVQVGKRFVSHIDTQEMHFLTIEPTLTTRIVQSQLMSIADATNIANELGGHVINIVIKAEA